MKPRTIEHLQYFIGKVCSIVATSMNRSFDEKISREHFVVIVREIDVDGIWGAHPYNSDLISFFSLEHVISIHQEEVIDPSKPEHIQMIKDFEQKTGKKVQGDLKNSPTIKEESKNLLNVLKEKPPVPSEPSTGDATFVDIDSLERLAEDTRRAFDQYDAFDLRRKS
jgi:hypothetical protein